MSETEMKQRRDMAFAFAERIGWAMPRMADRLDIPYHALAKIKACKYPIKDEDLDYLERVAIAVESVERGRSPSAMPTAKEAEQLTAQEPKMIAEDKVLSVLTRHFLGAKLTDVRNAVLAIIDDLDLGELAFGTIKAEIGPSGERVAMEAHPGLGTAARAPFPADHMVGFTGRSMPMRMGTSEEQFPT